MNSNNLSNILHAFVYLSDSLFIGLKFFVPVIFILKIFKIFFKESTLLNLTLTANYLALTGGILFMVNLLTNTLLTLASDNEDEWSFMMSMATGPHWFQFIIPILNYGILPFILLNIKFRHSIYSSVIIVLCWLVSGYLIDYLSNLDQRYFQSHPGLSASEYTAKGLIFILMTILLYCIIQFRKKRSANN